MRLRLRTWCAALAAMIAGSTTLAMAASPDGRFIVSNRQKVRAELAAAMADGELSHMEQYGILLRAKDRLNSSELRGVQQTLERLSTQKQQQPPAEVQAEKAPVRRQRKKPTFEEIPLQQPVAVTSRPDRQQHAGHPPFEAIH